MSDEDELSPNLMGNRAGDRGGLSLREAIHLFAMKEETAAMNTAIQSIASQVNLMVPRAEHQLRWRQDDERYKRLDEQMSENNDKVNAKLDRLLEKQLPSWFMPAAAVVVPAVVGLVVLFASHYWR